MPFLDMLEMEQTHLPLPVLCFRIVLAVGLGAVIGFERERRQRAAGLRTHMLVAMAAALFTIIALELYYLLAETAPQRATDPIRAIEAVTAGIAFLGAGAIFRSGRDVHGLTTGAGMWLAGAVGVASATGYYVLAALCTLLALIILFALRGFERELGSK